MKVGVAFAGMKNGFVLRRVFAAHQDMLRGLRRDLLGRQGELSECHVFTSERAPLALRAKLSILSVRCRDRMGATSVVDDAVHCRREFVKHVVCTATGGLTKLARTRLH